MARVAEALRAAQEATQRAWGWWREMQPRAATWLDGLARRTDTARVWMGKRMKPVATFVRNHAAPAHTWLGVRAKEARNACNEACNWLGKRALHAAWLANQTDTART